MQSTDNIVKIDNKEAELEQSASKIVNSLLGKGPKLYQLHLDLAVLRNIVWEMRTQRYIEDVKNCLINLPTELLTAVDFQVEELMKKQHEAKIAADQKEKKISKKKANLN